MQKLLFLLILLPISGLSQNFVDLANVYYRSSPFNSSEYWVDDQMHFNTIAADLTVPIPISENLIIITGLDFHQASFVFNDDEGSSLQQLRSFTLQTGAELKWNDKFKTMFMLMNKLNGDFDNNKGIGAYHQIGGAIFNTYQRSETFAWKYGLYYNSELFAPMFVPLFGFNWQINDKWMLKTTIPVNLELSCKARDWFRYGLRFDGVNGSYFMDYAGQELYVDRADNNAWLFTDFYITKNIVFHLKAGHSVLRKYRYFNPSDKMKLKLGPVNIGDDRPETPAETVWFKNGWSFESRLIFRLPL